MKKSPGLAPPEVNELAWCVFLVGAQFVAIALKRGEIKSAKRWYRSYSKTILYLDRFYQNSCLVVFCRGSLR